MGFTLSVGSNDILDLLACSGSQDLHEDLLIGSCPLTWHRIGSEVILWRVLFFYVFVVIRVIG